MIPYLEPVMLYGAGEYNLNVVKEVKATKSFYTLDETVRQCQNKESMEQCRQRIFLETAMNDCKCLPFKIMSFGKVHRQVR